MANLHRVVRTQTDDEERLAQWEAQRLEVHGPAHRCLLDITFTWIFVTSIALGLFIKLWQLWQ
jgi:hypothetical protein